MAPLRPLRPAPCCAAASSTPAAAPSAVPRSRRRRCGPASPTSVATDSKGAFEIAAAPGAYVVRVNAEGFVETARRLALVDGAEATADFTLEIAGIHESVAVEGAGTGYAVPVVSSATRTSTPLRDVPQAVSVVSQRPHRRPAHVEHGRRDPLHAGRRHRAGRGQPRHADPARQQHDRRLLRRRRPRRRPVLPRRLQRRAGRSPQGAERDDLRPRRRRRRASTA